MAFYCDSEAAETSQGTLYADLWNLLKEDFETDTLIVSENDKKSLKAHRLILSARSPVLRNLLDKLKTQTEVTQNSITVNSEKICIADVSFIVIQTLITYMYTEKIPSLTILDFSNVNGGQMVFLLELLQLARRLEMVCLCTVTREILLLNLASEKLSYSPSDLLEAVDHALPRLSTKENSVRLAVLYRLACHLHDILQEQKLELVSLKTLQIIFQIGISHNNEGSLPSENCKLTPLPELDYFSAALRWARHNCESHGIMINGPNLRNALGDLIHRIHFSRLNSVELADKIRQSDILTADEMVSYLSRSVLKFPPAERKTAALHRKILHHRVFMFQPVELSVNIQRESYYFNILNLRFLKSTVLLTSFAVRWIYPRAVFLRIFRLPQEKCIFSTPFVHPKSINDHDDIYHVFQVAVNMLINQWYRIEISGQMIHDNENMQQRVTVPAGKFETASNSSEHKEFETFLPNKTSSSIKNESCWFPASLVQYVPVDLLYAQDVLSVSLENQNAETIIDCTSLNLNNSNNSKLAENLSIPTMISSSPSKHLNINRSNDNSQDFGEFSASSSSASTKRAKFDFETLKNQELKINNRISNLQTRIENKKLQLVQTKLECKPMLSSVELFNSNCITQESSENVTLPMLEQIGVEKRPEEGLKQTIDEANDVSRDNLLLISSEPEPDMPQLKLEISDSQF